MSEHILVIKHGAFGDIIQADGALRDIRVGHPQAHISLLTTPPYRTLMSRCPHVDAILLDRRARPWQLGEHFALWRTLRGGHFTRVYDLQKSARSERYRRWILPHTPWFGRSSEVDREISALASFTPLLRAAGIEPVHVNAPCVDWMVDDMTELLAAHGVRAPFIALIPGSSAAHPHKRWPHYAALGEALLAHGFDVVTAPGPDELELARSLPGHALLKADGKYLDWFELAGVLARADFVIGNDTGPSHLAAHLGRPGLALFGPHTSAARTAIEREHFKAIECADLAALPVDTVLTATLARLGGG